MEKLIKFKQFLELLWFFINFLMNLVEKLKEEFFINFLEILNILEFFINFLEMVGTVVG